MNKSGFSTLEVTISVGIVGALAAIVMHQFGVMMTQAKVNMATLNTKQVSSQLTLYVMSCKGSAFDDSQYKLYTIEDLKNKGYKIPANSADFTYTLTRYDTYYEIAVITNFNHMVLLKLRIYEDGREAWSVNYENPWAKFSGAGTTGGNDGENPRPALSG